MPFRLLAYLARFPGIGASYEDIEQNVWNDTQVERQQILAHRTKITDAFERVVSSEAAERLIEVKRGRGLCLAMESAQIRVLDS